jgi:hypothetical protein
MCGLRPKLLLSDVRQLSGWKCAIHNHHMYDKYMNETRNYMYDVGKIITEGLQAIRIPFITLCSM